MLFAILFVVLVALLFAAAFADGSCEARFQRETDEIIARLRRARDRADD